MRPWTRFVTVVGGRRSLMILGVGYLAVAVLLSTVSTSHDDSVLVIAIVAVFIGGSGLVLLVGAHRLPRTDIDPAFYPVIFERTIAGIAVMLAILALYHGQPDTGLSEPVRSLSILTGFSAVAGFAVGLSDARTKTREHELERQNRLLERTQAELEASNEQLEQFAYAASHDLQEPLRMISSYLQLLEQRHGDELDEEGEVFLEYAVDGSERMQAMIDGLLELSRVGTQGGPLAPVDLEAVLEDVLTDLERRIEEADADIEVHSLPRVSGDASQLRQLFQNLVANAVEYSSDGSPRIVVDAERDDEEWIVSVHDNGIGIDPDDQKRIFEVFQRLHSREEHPGTGIGLALCKRVVERHGGEIWVESEPGDGSTFSVSLPAVDAPISNRSPQRESPKSNSPSSLNR